MSIMDLIMFDAQRQGRLSFYMVHNHWCMVYSMTVRLTRLRYLPVRRASQLARLQH